MWNQVRLALPRPRRLHGESMALKHDSCAVLSGVYPPARPLGDHPKENCGLCSPGQNSSRRTHTPAGSSPPFLLAGLSFPLSFSFSQEGSVALK